MKIQKFIDANEYKIEITVESRTVHGHAAMTENKDEIQKSLEKVGFEVMNGVRYHRIKNRILDIQEDI